MRRPSNPLEKLNHGCVAVVIDGPCEHVRGPLYVEEFGVWNQFLKVAHIFHGDDLTLRATQQQRRNSNSASGFCVAPLGLVGVGLVSGEKSLIPMPVVSAIVAQSQIALQTGKIPGSGSMRKIFGNGVSGLLEVGKALPHATTNPAAPPPVPPAHSGGQHQQVPAPDPPQFCPRRWSLQSGLPL